MTILDRYILKRLLVTFFFVVFILMTIITVIDITEKMEKFVHHELGFAEVLGYYLDFIPFIASLITPLTVFIATVYITARMAGHTEIIAMLSSGLSFKRMMLPYVFGAIIIGGLNFYLTGWVIPDSNKTKLDFEIKYLNKPYVYSEQDVHIQVGPDEFLYLRRYNNNINRGNQFTLEKIIDIELKEKLSAKTINWIDSTQKWRLNDWKHWTMEGEKEVVTTGKHMDTVLAINPKEFSNDYRRYDGMTIPELEEYIGVLKGRGASNIEVYEVEKYVRFTSPFAVLILTFMGVIVSSKKSRGGAGFRIALGFLLSFIFILLFILTKSVAEVGDINPAYSVWIPNMIFGTLALIMYKTVPK
ncbi:MAG: LptF/LptG family permease [Cyclobacteriaceae bacterium]|nr:LptF/LptG family permease [Cyclobacteriaceae bacterium]